jgi:hypothetical protein
MNRQAMEQALGKLVMDRGFRDAFFRDPAAATETVGIRLTEHEWSALTRIRPGALAAFERYLHSKRFDGHEGADAWARPEPW